MITPDLLMDRRRCVSIVSFGGYEIILRDSDVLSHRSYIRASPTSTYNPFITEVSLRVRLGLDEAALYKNSAEAAVSMLQETGPPHKFYCTEDPKIFGIAGHEFRAQSVILSEASVPYERTRHRPVPAANLFYSVNEPVKIIEKFIELTFHAHCRDI